METACLGPSLHPLGFRVSGVSSGQSGATESSFAE